MRTLLVTVLFLAGCSKPAPPKPKVRLPDTPSLLVVEPAKPTGPTDATLFDLPKDRLYLINGSWKSRSDLTRGDYQRPGEFSFELADGGNVDPKEIAEHIFRWIDRAGVRVIERGDSSAGADRIQRTIDYQTERTAGRLDVVIQPAVPAKKVTATFDIRERRR